MCYFLFHSSASPQPERNYVSWVLFVSLTSFFFNSFPTYVHISSTLTVLLILSFIKNWVILYLVFYNSLWHSLLSIQELVMVLCRTVVRPYKPLYGLVRIFCYSANPDRNVAVPISCYICAAAVNILLHFTFSPRSPLPGPFQRRPQTAWYLPLNTIAQISK